MSDKQKHPLIADLSQSISSVWPNVSDKVKADIKAAVAVIETQLNLGDAALAEFEKSPLPEAPVSANFRAVHTGTQAEVQFTLRGRTYVEVKTSIAAALADLASTGWQTFDQYVDQRKSERAAQQPPQPQRPAATTEPSAPQQAAVGGNWDGTFSCHAKELLAMPKSTSDSTLIWKVMTDKSKYPVPLYEETAQELAEVLALAGIDVNTFVVNGQPAKYSLAGWVAHYVKKDGTDFPKKIVNLTR